MIQQRPRNVIVLTHYRSPATNWWQLATIMLAALSLCACQSRPSHRPRGAIPSGYDGGGSGMMGPGMSGPGMQNPMQQGMPPSQPAGVPFGAVLGANMGGQPTMGMGGPYGPPPVADRVFCDCGQGTRPTCGPACGGCNACGPASFHPDEYLCDGGDQNVHANLNREGAIRGLDIEDTVASYECHDGLIQIEPSNRVCIYAPRFASVRKVDGAISSDQIDQVAGVDVPTVIARQRESLKPGAAMQPQPPVIEIANRKAVAFRERLKAEGILERVRTISLQDAMMPYEDFSIIRLGIAQQGEKPRLAERAQAAITWIRDQSAQVVIDGKRAMAEESIETAEQTYYIDEPECPKLRVCKVASTSNALPGEEVDFTIRFDNVGHSAAKNVVLYDNLTTRLEYIPNSAQASVKAKFFAQENEADSLVLKWTIDQPIEPGCGGVVRFRCKVR